ncbi:hypothetical protein [Bradyrhizobium uaiense]|uniref:Uncharacterized protein n=1 Tax=Bradyrhizobium uaiense TaxID=2594946 RepID=A0A6P1B8F8_9BRAD|nr:hypothetical protein [Bradyrhizobium uaiense]NEU94817.1 hypothetical protein [Bradyrhizobium uaiense]
MTVYLPGLNETDLKKIIRAVHELGSGRSNAIGTVTLAVSATSTTVLDQNCAAGSAIILMPQTSDAAAAISTTYIPAATVQNGSFVVQHASNTLADRTFTYAIQG